MTDLSTWLIVAIILAMAVSHYYISTRKRPQQVIYLLEVMSKLEGYYDKWWTYEIFAQESDAIKKAEALLQQKNDTYNDVRVTPYILK